MVATIPSVAPPKSSARQARPRARPCTSGRSSLSPKTAGSTKQTKAEEVEPISCGGDEGDAQNGGHVGGPAEGQQGGSRSPVEDRQSASRSQAEATTENQMVHRLEAQVVVSEAIIVRQSL